MTNESPEKPRQSRRRRSAATLTVMLLLGIYWAALFYGTHTRLPPNALPGNTDKLVHFSAFLGLGVLLMTLRVTQGPFSWRSIIIRWFILAGYGVFDEVTQALVGRDAELYDWLADSLGAAIGLCLVTSIYRAVQGRKKELVTNQ